MSNCKDCQNRFVGCHSTCEVYKEWKSALLKDNAKRKSHERSAYYDGYNGTYKEKVYTKYLKDKQRRLYGG